ncbi:MAG: helix-turn-helix domain-containing protein [Pirellulales bacterium]
MSGTNKADGWARIPWGVIDAAIGPHALAVYCAIARHADKNGKAHPSMQRIADVAGVSKGNAKSSVAALIARGFLSRTNRRKADGSADSPLYRLAAGVGGWVIR